jgi:8-oxo-dGTP pyrophosphatase MutT (NUDIX family)
MSMPAARVALVEATKRRKHEVNQLRWSAVIVPSNPRPAATVVVLRDSSAGPEVFMVRRHEGTAFMGGAHVFPGGRVDAADHQGTDAWCDGIAHAGAETQRLRTEVAEPATDSIAYYVAAARELFEEAGVMLARDRSGGFVSLASAPDHDRFTQARSAVHSGATTLREFVEREHLRLALDALVVFAHWVTPPIDPRQFDTRFFIARVPPQQTPAHDDTETTHSAWIRPADAIAQSLRGDIVLPPPTFTTLRELEPFASVEDSLAWARRRRIVRRMPHLLEDESSRMLLLPGDPLHPDPPGDELPRETRFVFVDARWRPERPRT